MHTPDLLTLPVFVFTFLEAAKSPNLHDTSTLDMLCRLIQDEHFALSLPPEQSLLNAQTYSMPRVLEMVHGALNLVRVSYTSLSRSPFHDLISSASQLLMLLLSCVNDMTSISAGQAMMHYAEVLEILQLQDLHGDLKAVLEPFALSLNMIMVDDSKMAQEAQLMQSLQLSISKGDILGPNSESDIASCSLLLRHLVVNRTTTFGSGSPAAVAILVTAFRWTTWSPRIFYTQLFLAAISILSQSNSHKTNALIWRSFIITRLTRILSDFEQVLTADSVGESEWRGAIQAAFLSIQSRIDLLSQCDTSATSRDVDDMNVDPPDSMRSSSVGSSTFFTSLIQYCALRTSLFDNSTRMMFKSTIEPTLNTLLSNECQETGSTLDAYIESRLISDGNKEETLLPFLRRCVDDILNHPQIAKAVIKRVETLCQQVDVEGLGVLCKTFNSLDVAMDIFSLHVRIDDILAPILAFIDDFDCESVGDPQTGLEYLGNVILFLQATLVKYQLSSHIFTLGDRVLATDYLLSTSTVFRMSSLGLEDVNVVKAWSKALFDTNSEGIEDNILRTTKPKMLMKLTATLILQACNACADRRWSEDMLKNGVSYFTGPLLNWTLVGGIKALLRDIMEKDFNTPIHLETLQTLVESSLCPKAVISLTGHGILALATDPRASVIESKSPKLSFKAANLRAIASKALGIDDSESSDAKLKSLSIPSSHWLDQPRKSIREFFNAARAGRAPAFDVGRCVAVLGPTRFLRLLWDELDTPAKLGELEVSRRLATYVLLCPPAATGAGAGRTPPLLPIFLGSVLHGLLTRLDLKAPAEQTLGIELLVSVLTSSLTGLLHLEWALRAVGADTQIENHAYQPSVTIARRLAADLRRSKSPSAAIVIQRLSSSPSFVANFPVMAA
ncbi:uncharacterized protein FOMMEDRAFT_154950 [Fomitiporia mediterranea MF3/22]|uniref:uncharacterized protein n=1 Tax=Fomitiporia mediterranea (strain MF3/22) TaxID=694068 RepID=UPI0004408083|nr:uncharacterized protein FOMMEDRAFT_154950 [Fomitiporia mediterranea MF3/22]EJD03833.1 hypothetical protein FOMMEDRAFT_154950 [Fomitiporia mediterranea MF3/22]